MGDNHLLLAEGERGGGASKTAGWNGGGGHGKRGEEAKRFMKEFCQSELGGLNIPTFCGPATLLWFLSLCDMSELALHFYPLLHRHHFHLYFPSRFSFVSIYLFLCPLQIRRAYFTFLKVSLGVHHLNVTQFNLNGSHSSGTKVLLKACCLYKDDFLCGRG